MFLSLSLFFFSPDGRLPGIGGQARRWPSSYLASGSTLRLPRSSTPIHSARRPPALQIARARTRLLQIPAMAWHGTSSLCQVPFQQAFSVCPPRETGAPVRGVMRWRIKEGSSILLHSFLFLARVHLWVSCTFRFSDCFKLKIYI